jgi:hypothetical protein
MITSSGRRLGPALLLPLAFASGLTSAALAADIPPPAERRCTPPPGRVHDRTRGPSSLVIAGCVNAANLALMASPADLLEGRPLAPADGARQASIVEAYQRGQARKLDDGGANKSATLVLPATQSLGGQ